MVYSEEEIERGEAKPNVTRKGEDLLEDPVTTNVPDLNGGVAAAHSQQGGVSIQGQVIDSAGEMVHKPTPVDLHQ